MTGVSVKMFYVLLMCPVLLASAVLTLTIDSILGTSIEDCFERIAIGEQLPASSIYRNVSELTTKECEQICKQDKQCQAYDYGVGAKGNSTCDLSNTNEKQIKEEKLLLRNPDYDVYVRRIQCEQSPPTPLDQEILENGPLHRPVIRPDQDKPLADEYEDYRPDRRPYDDKNPDDRPPSYGEHIPPNIPYEKPVYDSHRRPRPNFRPDPYGGPNEEIHDVYGPRPDTERPQYQYIIRPNRKPNYNIDYPRPDDRPYYNYNSQYASNYGGQDNSIHVEIYDPPRYKPVKRPYESSVSYGQSYGYNQYQESSHSGYGQESYKPERPEGGYEFSTSRPQYSPSQYGQNSYSTGNKFSQTQQYGQSSYATSDKISVSNHYGQSDGQSHSQGGYGLLQTSERPSYRPNYENEGYASQSGNGHSSHNSQSSYGQSQATQNSYGSNSYNGQSSKPTSSYGQVNHESSSYNQASYHQSQTSQYETNKFETSQYGPNKRPYNEPNYDNNSLFGSHLGYGTHHLYDIYGIKRPNERPYDRPEKPNGYQPTGYGETGYQSSKPSGYGTKPNDGYGQSEKPSGYQPVTGYGETGYQSSKPSGYGTKPNDGYAQSEKPSGYGYETKPNDGYGQTSRPSYSESVTKPSYGNYDKPYGYGQSARPGYGSNYETKPNDGYKPSYDSKPNGYGTNYDSKPSYSQKPSYQESNGYEQSKPSYDTKPNDYNKPRPSYEPNSGYQKPRPQYTEFEKPSGYGTSDTNNGYGTSHTNYNHTGFDPDRPDVKPVYEFEFEKPEGPSYIAKPDGNIVTTRPVTIGYEKPGFGRNPEYRGSYKGK